MGDPIDLIMLGFAQNSSFQFTLTPSIHPINPDPINPDPINPWPHRSAIDPSGLVLEDMKLSAEYERALLKYLGVGSAETIGDPHN